MNELARLRISFIEYDRLRRRGRFTRRMTERLFLEIPMPELCILIRPYHTFLLDIQAKKIQESFLEPVVCPSSHLQRLWALLPRIMLLYKTKFLLVGDYYNLARRAMEIILPEGHLIPPEECIILPEGCHRP